MINKRSLDKYLNKFKGFNLGIEVDVDTHTLRIISNQDLHLDTISIYGVEGSIKFSNVQSNDGMLNIKKLPSGNYTVLISTLDQVLVKQIAVA